MTVSKNLVVTCNGCHNSKTWAMSVLRDRTLKSVLKNAGYEKDHKGLLEGTDHYCPDCNDREKETFHVYDGCGDTYLGTVEAWGIVHARRVAWDTFECENVVKRERQT